MSTLIDVMQANREHLELTKCAAGLLHALVSSKGGNDSEAASLRNRELFLGRQDGAAFVISLLREDEFYVRLLPL